MAAIAVALFAGACGGPGGDTAAVSTKPAAAPADVVPAPAATAAPPAPVVGAAAPVQVAAPTVSPTTSAVAAAGAVTAEQTAARPDPGMTVAVDRACVERGQTLTISVSGARPATALGWAIAYRDGAPKESMGFGETDASGSWTTTVLVVPAAPLGEGRAVVGAASDDGSYKARGLAPFRVEEVGGCA